MGIKEDKAEAVKWTRKAADQGLAKAQLMLGCYIGTGQGVKEDLTEAAKWFRAAAEQGNSKAQVILSEFYFYGIGVKKDYQEAREWSNTAARELGGKISFYRVEEPYKSYYFHWIKRAAEQGDAEAQSKLGSLYQTGFCCKDMTEAMKWFRKAAEQGNQSGINQLKTFERDCENAERGDAEAQYQLGRIYAQGDSEGKYLSEAMKWLRKAAEQGHGNAISFLKELEKKK